MLPPSRILVIVDGHLPGMLACAAAVEANRPTPSGRVFSAPLAWMAGAQPGDSSGKAEAARRAAEHYGLEFLCGPTGPADVGEHESVTRMLLDAAFEAARRGADAVVWPVCCLQGAMGEADVERMGLAADRALLVQRLVSLGRRRVEVLTPYLDFGEREIAELAIDLNVPVHLCWWWEAPDVPEAAVERSRWTAAMGATGWAPGATARAADAGR